MPSGIKTRTSGIMVNINVEPAASGFAGGLGDVVSGASAYWGLRAYNSAYATGSNPAIDIVKTSDGSNPQTINIASNGTLDVATIAGLGYGVSVSKIYDQTGNGTHLTQATLSKMPIITLSGLGSRPTMDFSAAASMVMTNASFAVSQPFSVSSVAKHTASGASQVLWSSGNGVATFYRNAGNNQVSLFATSVDNTSTASDGSFHALGQIYASGSSLLKVDSAASTTGNPGGTAILNLFVLGAQGDAGGQFLDGSFCETGIWFGDFTANLTAFYTNQSAYFGI
jgi:hypothetical protein